MALHVLIGPAGSGKSARVHQALVDCVGRGGRGLLLVPSSQDVSRAVRDLAPRAPLGLEVRSFDDYLNGLWLSCGDGRQLVSPAQRLTVLEDIGKSWHRESTGLSSHSTGAVKTLVTLVQRAGETGFKHVERRANGGSAAPKGAASAGTVLLGDVIEYSHRLAAAGLVERSEAQRFAAEAGGTVELPSVIALDGITGLTRAQEDFIAAAAKITEVTVALTYDARVPATSSAGPLVERLSAVGSVEVLDAGATELPAELSRVARTLGSAPGVPEPAAGAVILSEAWGEAAEASRITREVQDALGQGIRAGEIAVVFRDAAVHLRQIQLALAEAEIPAEFDLKTPFGMTGMGRVLILVLEASRPNAGRSALMDVLRSPYSPASDETLDELDVAMRGRRSSDARAIEAWCRRNDPVADAFLRELRAARASLAKGDPERAWYRLISAMMGRRWAGETSSSHDQLADAAAGRAFMDAVSGMSALGARGDASVLSAALAETTVGIGSSGSPDRVQVMSAERARGRRFKCVIVGGLNDAEFPRRNREDALTSPDVGAPLRSAGIDLAPRSGIAEERLLFYQVVTRATGRLVLSWQSHDDDGRPRRPSVFLEETLDLYRDPETNELAGDGPPHRVLGLDSAATAATGPSTWRRALRSVAAGIGEAPRDSDAVLAHARARAQRARASSSDGVRRAMEGRSTFSATEIETYLQCPFRWCISHLVRPRELDDRLDAASAGRLAHEIMRRFYAELEERTGFARVTEGTLEQARSVHAAVAAASLEEMGANSVVEEATLRAVSIKTARLVEEDARLLPGFEPTHLEWDFGADGDAESFGDFELRGRIDRIDVDGGRLVVTDYKSGSSADRRRAELFEQEGLVQLPLYAAVAARRLGLEVAGGLYRAVGGGKPRGFVREDVMGDLLVDKDKVGTAGVDSLIADAVERACTAVTGMRAGEIPPAPRSGKCPSYCPARGMCSGWRPDRA